MQMNNRFNGSSSPAVNGGTVLVNFAMGVGGIPHGFRLMLDYIKMGLTSGKVRAADRDTLCTHPRTQHHTICASKALVRPHNGPLNRI